MIEFLVRKRKITILFFAMITILGMLSFLQLPRREDPEIIINVATVQTVFPGAPPEKVEQMVTKKLEERINEIQGLKSISSTSSSGVSMITVEAEDDADPKAKWEELRKKVQDAEADLPDDAEQPVINDDLNRTFIETMSVYADSFDQLYSVRDLLKSWKDRLRTIPGVADVTIDGLPEKQVLIEADIQKLQQYGISWAAVLSAIQRENERTPLGVYQVGARAYELRLDDVRDPEEFADTLIARTPEGAPIFLKDIGTVRMTTERVTQYGYYNGKPSLSISVNAESGTDVPQVQAQVDDTLAYLVKDKPTWLRVESIFSQNQRVDYIFHDLARETLIAVAAVIFVCTLGLNLITSFAVAMAIPISMAVGMIPLPYLGISLNQISIIGLIIVLGILVDDAVVVNDNIERRLSALGERPYVAAVRGSREVSMSILTATLATIASFGPLFFLKGNAGQFIRAIPIIIALSMLASMAMALTIIPIFRWWHEARKFRAPGSGGSGEAGSSGGSAEYYRKPAGLLGKQIQALNGWYSGRLMPRLLQNPLKTGLIGILIGTLAYGLVPMIPVELFPPANRAEFLIDVRSAPGGNIQETDRLVREVADWVGKQEEVATVAAYSGMNAPKMFGGDTENGSGESVGQLVVKLAEAKAGTRDVVDPWNERFKQMFPGAVVKAKELETGPPVGAPVDIRIYGDDLDTLQRLTAKVKQLVAKTPGTANEDDSLGVRRNTLRIELNKDMMDRLLVNAADVTRSIRLASEGVTVSEFDDGSDLVNMVLKVRDGEDDPNALLQRLTVTNALGRQIPLSQLASLKPDFALGNITHRNLSRVAEVTADVEGRTATETMQEITPKLAAISWPDGYRYEIGGETSEQTDIFIDMGKLSVVVVFLILILIALQFYSISIPVLVMSTVYLAAAGSMIGLFITRTPLGFMTMMGVISLSGIVVRNGIVLVEFIEEARHAGAELKEAVIQAGEARLRPILLTTATAISGLLPLAISGDVLFRPLAVTIIFGLAFSTLLTLVIVPSLYMVIARRRMKRESRKRETHPELYEIRMG